MKPVVQLWDNNGFGVIIDYPSGVFYSNQTGGTACFHSEIEGVYVPLKNSVSNGYKFVSPEIELFNYFEGPKHKGAGARNGLDKEDADFIESVLKRWELSSSLEVNREHLKGSHEAWVYVTVLADEGNSKMSDTADSLGNYGLSIFSGFQPYPRAGILTWSNTD